MFARKGFHGTGTAELAARAGCSEPTLYKYFPSKQAVFAAVLDDATELHHRAGGRADARRGGSARGAAARDRPARRPPTS